MRFQYIASMATTQFRAPLSCFALHAGTRGKSVFSVVKLRSKLADDKLHFMLRARRNTHTHTHTATIARARTLIAAHKFLYALIQFAIYTQIFYMAIYEEKVYLNDICLYEAMRYVWIILIADNCKLVKISLVFFFCIGAPS